jgi:hypothetical protein
MEEARRRTSSRDSSVESSHFNEWRPDEEAVGFVDQTRSQRQVVVGSSKAHALDTFPGLKQKPGKLALSAISDAGLARGTASAICNP